MKLTYQIKDTGHDNARRRMVRQGNRVSIYRVTERGFEADNTREFLTVAKARAFLADA